MPNKLSLACAALLASAVSAQLAGLPSCAIKPAFAVIGQSECQLTEFKCICANAGLLQSLTSTVQQACTNTADLSSAAAAASSICEPYAAAAAASSSRTGAAYAVASATGSATAAASSGLVTAASTAKATTAAPYAAGNATRANSTGASNNNSSSGNLVVAGSAATPPKMRDLGLVAAFLAVMGGAALF